MCPHTPNVHTHQEQIDDICQKSDEVWKLQAAARLPSHAQTKPLKRPLNQPVVISRSAPASFRRRHVSDYPVPDAGQTEGTEGEHQGGGEAWNPDVDNGEH